VHFKGADLARTEARRRGSRLDARERTDNLFDRRRRADVNGEGAGRLKTLRIGRTQRDLVLAEGEIVGAQ
jgi:hypothetical protein